MELERSTPLIDMAESKYMQYCDIGGSYSVSPFWRSECNPTKLDADYVTQVPVTMLYLEYLVRLDNEFTLFLRQYSFTANLISTTVSEIITKFLFVCLFGLILYETIYWSGIKVGIWEYHANDIFKEIPVHCAHLYCRVNVVRSKDLDKLNEYYRLKHTSNALISWTRETKLLLEIFALPKFVKYHFEFSPEDFEMNKDPEWGSTVLHLREKIAALFSELDVYKQFHDNKPKPHDVLIYDTRYSPVGKTLDGQYLSKVGIETGNVIDTVVRID